MLALAAGLWLAAGASACVTPVFRYALERWEPSTYQALVFHRGPLNTNDQAVLGAVRQMAEEQKVLNLAIVTADLGGPLDPALQEIWKKQSNAPLPRLVLRYPDTQPENPDAWAGPLNKDAVRQLVDSPLRREVAKRIAAGQAAVWILLECGDKKQDDQAAELLGSTLKAAEQTIELPPDPALDQTNATELKVSFSLLRSPRNDPQEAVFTHMLLAVDEDMAQMKSPLAVPVFGRGRALCALPGPQITSPIIKEALAFLIGSCSCEVKELNPGLDLLMIANWEEALEGKRLSDHPLPALIGLGGLTEKPKAPPAKAAPVVLAAAPATEHHPLYRNIILASVGLLVLVGAATLLVSKGRK